MGPFLTFSAPCDMNHLNHSTAAFVISIEIIGLDGGLGHMSRVIHLKSQWLLTTVKRLQPGTKPIVMLLSQIH